MTCDREMLRTFKNREFQRTMGQERVVFCVHGSPSNEPLCHGTR